MVWCRSIILFLSNTFIEWPNLFATFQQILLQKDSNMSKIQIWVYTTHSDSLNVEYLQTILKIQSICKGEIYEYVTNIV